MANPSIIYYAGQNVTMENLVPQSNRSALAITNGGTFPESTAFDDSELATPFRTGYTFVGWYADKNFSDQAVTNAAVGTTYYAKWDTCAHADMAYCAAHSTITETCSACGHAATATISAPSGTLNYDGNAKAAEVTCSDNWQGDGLTITYTKDGQPFSGTPTDAGTYTASITAGSATATVEFTIGKASTSVSISAAPTSLIGGGTVTLTVDTSKLPEGGTVSVSCDKDDIKIVENDNGTYTAEMPNRGGEYTFTAVYNGDAWYNGATATCTVTVVTKATPVEPIAVGYLVEYYLEGRWGYELEDTEFFTGKIGDTVTAQPKDYPGYRYNEQISTASGTLIAIEDEGDIVTLKLYYDERTTSRPSGGSSTPSYTVSVEDVVNGTVETDPRRAQEGEEVTITVTPDDGYELDTLTVIDRDGDEVEVTEERDGTFTFEMPDSRVTIEATFVPVAEDIVPEIPTDWANPYADVAANAWYYDAVAYVTANGLMNGTSATTFAPNVTTTRAMIWTVLARMNGQSVDGGTPWYTLAQSWAMRANVSDGTNPADPISREELATMLYRAAGSPAVSGNLLSYPDGSSVSAWAESAMLWATQNGIISGIDGMLTPQGQATRAQVATMLMRFREVVIH